MAKLAILASVLVAFGAVAQHAYADLYDAPLPDDVFVMEPSPMAPEAVKPFVGRWEGTLIGAHIQNRHIIVVERLDPNFAWVIWSVGTGRSVLGGSPAAWFRVPGKFDNSELVLSINAARAVYTLNGSNELDVVSTVQGFTMKGVLKRMATPALPFSEKQPPTYWPPNIGRWEPGPSSSPVRAELPDSVVIAPAAYEVPPERKRWLGIWSGAACSQRACDLKLAVLDVTTDSARVIHLYASKGSAPNPRVRDAVFEGEELILRAGRMRVAYRMRPSGVVEMMRVSPGGDLAWGVLTKDP